MNTLTDFLEIVFDPHSNCADLTRGLADFGNGNMKKGLAVMAHDLDSNGFRRGSKHGFRAGVIGMGAIDLLGCGIFIYFFNRNKRNKLQIEKEAADISLLKEKIAVHKTDNNSSDPDTQSEDNVDNR